MSGSNWADRRGLFQKGKEKHEPAPERRTSSISEAVRRASVGSTGGGSPIEKTPSAGSSTGASRRRSSAASGGALFNNLTGAKRGSEDYDTKRAGHSEMTGQAPGMLSGWYNKTFRGTGGPNPGQSTGQADQK